MVIANIRFAEIALLSNARARKGKRTRQYNPGARSLAEYTEAVVHHTRSSHDAGGFVHCAGVVENEAEPLPSGFSRNLLDMR
jgi:hypothetical protein